jgi:hypothetical protein
MGNWRGWKNKEWGRRENDTYVMTAVVTWVPSQYNKIPTQASSLSSLVPFLIVFLQKLHSIAFFMTKEII